MAPKRMQHADDRSSAAAATTTPKAAARDASHHADALVSPPDGLVAARSASTFSSAARKKHSIAHRTGQACDRCKIRKIRCDARLGGCSPCQQNNTECKTTDRITGRATSRGYTETVEHENQNLKLVVHELQQQLRQLGIEPKPVSNYYMGAVQSSPPQWPPPPYLDVQQMWTPQTSTTSSRTADQTPALPQKAQPEPASIEAEHSGLSSLRAERHGDNYVGVASVVPLSLIKGTSLSVFGMEIDVARYMPNDDPDSPLSYTTFLRLATGRGPKLETSWKDLLPETMEAYEANSNWFMTAINSWLPILDRVSFRIMIKKLYNTFDYQPDVAEIVIAHMVLAMWKYQVGTRNNANPQFRAESTRHYHYAIRFIPDLIIRRSLMDLQALTLIAAHLRSFPTPGAAWMVSNWVRNIAQEVGLHRSAKAWHDHEMQKDPKQLEIRKRVFWVLLMINVSVGGRMGHNMPLRPDDFDIELPEPVPDNFPSEPSACSYVAAIENMKLTLLFLETYQSIYTVKKRDDYADVVKYLEGKADAWREQIPTFISDLFAKPGFNPDISLLRVHALWIQAWSAELQIVIHHPALCRSASQELIARNLKICADASADLIRVATELSKIKSLDTTWINATIYVAATFTLLFAFWTRRRQITPEEMEQLRDDMDLSSALMLEVGSLVGSGSKLQLAISPIIETCLNNIGRHIKRPPGGAALPPNTSQAGSAESQTDTHNDPAVAGTIDGGTYNPQYPNVPPISAHPSGFLATNEPALSSSHGNYPVSLPHDYNASTATSVAPYTYGTNAFDQTGFNVVPNNVSTQAPMASAMTVAPGQFGYANIPYQDADPNFAGQQGWRTFVDTVKAPLYGPNQYHPASALMQLGGHEAVHVDGAQAATIADMSSALGHGHILPTDMAAPLAAQAWPVAQYTDPNQGREGP